MTSFHFTKGCLLPHWITASKPAFTNHSPYHRSITASPFQLFQYFNSVCWWLSSQHLKSKLRNNSRWGGLPSQKHKIYQNIKAATIHTWSLRILKRTIYELASASPISIPPTFAHDQSGSTFLRWFVSNLFANPGSGEIWGLESHGISDMKLLNQSFQDISGTLVLGGNHFKSRFTLTQFHGNRHPARCFQSNLCVHIQSCWSCCFFCYTSFMWSGHTHFTQFPVLSWSCSHCRAHSELQDHCWILLGWHLTLKYTSPN